MDTSTDTLAWLNILPKPKPKPKPYPDSNLFNLEEAFWSKVDIREVDECWNWTASITTHGYGRFQRYGTKIPAHRMSWILHNKKKIKSGMFICHHCDNKLCVNPNHLYCGTHADNMRDAMQRGLMLRKST